MNTKVGLGSRTDIHVGNLEQFEMTMMLLLMLVMLLDSDIEDGVVVLHYLDVDMPW